MGSILSETLSCPTPLNLAPMPPVMLPLLSTDRSPLATAPLTSELDDVLTAQLIVAWAGERGDDEKRLNWWNTNLLSDDGGRFFFSMMTPRTAEWAVLQAVREAARRIDLAARSQAHDSDAVFSLFSLGFEIDERVDERLHDLKRSGRPPMEALPALEPLLGHPWDETTFVDWAQGHGKGEFTTTASGRRIKGAIPSTLGMIVKRLVAAICPISKEYPLPYFKGAA